MSAGAAEMPWYVVAYLLVLAALAVASWQFADRVPGFVPAWLRNGDLLAAAGQILLTCAYWNEDLREMLGLAAAALFAALVGWLLFAIGPAVPALLAAWWWTREPVALAPPPSWPTRPDSRGPWARHR